MSSPAPRYPVDRYLVESSKTFGKVNRIDDDLWNSEPALRPEDEIILRKLQEMLQTTADDLKLLSQEIIMNKDHRIHVKTLPMPLDDEFNEKVHIQEIVDAKFHGYKVVDSQEYENQRYLFNNMQKTASIHKQSNTKLVEKNINTNTEFIPKVKTRPKNLGITKTRTLNIIDDNDKSKNNSNNVIPKKNIEKQTIAYSEYCYKYAESKEALPVTSSLNIQHMPSINIRSELKEQKVLQLDIVPETAENEGVVQNFYKNIAVHSVTHETAPRKIIDFDTKKPIEIKTAHLRSKQPLRKVLKMSTCDSSDSGNSHRVKNAEVRVNVHSIPTNPARSETIKKPCPTSKKKQISTNKSLEMWKRKLNAVYGHKRISPKKRIVSARINAETNISREINTPRSNLNQQLNNAQYIPYSKLTVGGARASDIEEEIHNLKDKNQAHIGPIIDKILSSRDLSFNEDKSNSPSSVKVLDTSDEKLLQEVIDIEEIVSQTLDDKKISNKMHYKQPDIPKINVKRGDSSSEETYDDDFEEDKSENEANDTEVESAKSYVSENQKKIERDPEENSKCGTLVPTADIKYVKSSNLSFKKAVDVFEFVPSVDTQEISTQSYTSQKISLKETQTSPLPEDTSPPPQIYNDLWPSIDPKGEVEKMFKLEKELIKKLILEEYGDLLETISKPSTSKDTKPPNQQHSNIMSTQKVTQTSPARVKSAMTSPRMTKTRMTSPFALSVTVNQQTSPIKINDQNELKIQIDDSHEDLGISINMSSPRFSLKLPQNSREVLSNLEVCNKTFIRSPKHKKLVAEPSGKYSKTFKDTVTSSSSSDELNTSNISSLGEITLKLRKKMMRRTNTPAISESSSTSSVKSLSDYNSHGILPLRSEGEISVGQIPKILVPSKSDGEISSKTTKKK